jgi:hypothetical protein
MANQLLRDAFGSGAARTFIMVVSLADDLLAAALRRCAKQCQRYGLCSIEVIYLFRIAAICDGQKI